MASEGGTPIINVTQSVRILGYHGFISLLWMELKSAVLAGDLVRPRQLGLIALSFPPPPPYLPLLPIFIHNVLPDLASSHSLLEKAVLVDLLVAIVASSLLMTMHFERSLPRGTHGPSPSASAMAKSVASTFRSIDGVLGQTLLNALASFPSFAYYFTL